MGRVCTKLPQTNHHRPHPIPVHTLFPTPSVSLDWRTLWRSSCGPLVPSERFWDSAHVHLQQAVRRHKAFADARRSNAPIYRPGDKVWLSTRDLRLRLPCKKLSPCYIGPFTILRQISEVTFHLQLPAPYRIHPVFHVSLLKPFSPSAPDPNEPAVPPPPEVLAEPTIYRVQNIMDSRRRGGHLEYFIDWEGYGPEERSWVARDDVLDPSLLAKFHQNPEAVAAPFVALGRQELPLEEGVLSESHSHHQPHSPDHNHLSTNHRHLSPLSPSTIRRHSSCTVTVWYWTFSVY